MKALYLMFLVLTCLNQVFANNTNNANQIYIYPPIDNCTSLDKWLEDVEVEYQKQYNIRTIKTKRGIREKSWEVDTSAKSNSGYEIAFKEFLTNEKIESHIAKISKEKQNKRINILDLYGSAIFTDKLKKVSSLTGVRIAPLQEKNIPNSFKRSVIFNRVNHFEISGNILKKSTWKKVDERIRELGIDGFDLVFYRPYGGTAGPWFKKDISIWMRFITFKEVYKRLSSKGELFASFDFYSESSRFDKCIYEYLKSQSINFDWDQNFWLKKNGATSKLSLPFEAMYGICED